MREGDNIVGESNREGRYVSRRQNVCIQRLHVYTRYTTLSLARRYPAVDIAPFSSLIITRFFFLSFSFGMKHNIRSRALYCTRVPIRSPSHLVFFPQVLTLNSNRVSSLSGLRQSSLACLELNGKWTGTRCEFRFTNYHIFYAYDLRARAAIIAVEHIRKG